jgi:hypothetical protein
LAERVICPACGAHGLEPFYRQHGVPVHSCLLLEDRDEALRFPSGSIDLAYCARCGFITNTAFHPGVHRYSEQYEETQEFSPRFQKFAHELATHWIDRYGLRHSEVLEIGCGKGSFLELFCELGDNEGVGVDPSYRRDRIPERDRLHFVQDFYDERWGPIRADAVICRHTLEHIAPVRSFLSTLRDGIGDATDTVVLFELPDTKRVLEEAAFWDVYYEHCSYFTCESLVHAFRSSGFQVLDVATAYDDQYLIIEAVPGPRNPNRRVPVGDLSEVRAAVDAFAPAVDRRRAEWNTRISDASASGQRVVVWGSGSKGVAYLTTLGLRDQVQYIVDVNPYKQGRYMAGTGHPIVGPQALPACPPDVVIVMNPIYRDEIACTLRDLGIDAEIVTT